MTRRPRPTFLDTNVLVYAVDAADPRKQDIALSLLEDPESWGGFVVSTQVMQEFYVTVTRKLAVPMDAASAAQRLDELEALTVVLIDPDLIHSAIRTSTRHAFSFWDGLILEAASRAHCERLLTEDLQDGFELRGQLVIENPFR